MSVFPNLVMRDPSGVLFFWTLQTDRRLTGKLVGLVHCRRGAVTVEETRMQHCVDGQRRHYGAAELIGQANRPPSGLRIETGLNESVSALEATK